MLIVPASVCLTSPSSSWLRLCRHLTCTPKVAIKVFVYKKMLKTFQTITVYCRVKKKKNKRQRLFAFEKAIFFHTYIERVLELWVSLDGAGQLSRLPLRSTLINYRYKKISLAGVWPDLHINIINQIF